MEDVEGMALPMQSAPPLPFGNFVGRGNICTAVDLSAEPLTGPQTNGLRSLQ
jgi:hypothetical protein